MSKPLLQLMHPKDKPTLESLRIPDFKPKPVVAEPEPVAEGETAAQEDHAKSADVETKEATPDADESIVDIDAPDAPTQPPEDEPDLEADAQIVPAEDEAAIEIETAEDEPQPVTFLPVEDVDETSEASTSPSEEDEPVVTPTSISDNETEEDEEDLPVIRLSSVDDDLTILQGINEVLRQRLHDLGFSTFEQISDLSDTQKEMIEDILDLPGRIEREHWVTQARHQYAIKTLAASDSDT